MEIVITHLTRMATGFCCAAGVDRATGKTIRILRRPKSGYDSRLPITLLKAMGGPFDVRAIVNVRDAVPRPKPPEVEDYLCVTEKITFVRRVTDPEFKAILIGKSKLKLSEIFGTEPTRKRASVFFPAGEGTASLGFYRQFKKGKLSISKGLNESKIRFECFLDGEWANLSVTDIRLYKNDCQTPDEAIVESLNRKIETDARLGKLVLGLGLTRPFAESPTEDAVHWLQVTGFHFI